MLSHAIICPECLTRATKWFEFGDRADPHSYYHCETCGCSCAVQDRQPGHRTPWVRVEVAVTFRAKPDRRRQLRVPPQVVAHRAYELHEQRGGGHGHDLDDWLRAERDLGGNTYVPLPGRWSKPDMGAES